MAAWHLLVLAAFAAAMPSHKEGGSDGGSAVAAPAAVSELPAAGAVASGGECVSGTTKDNKETGCGGSCYCLGGKWVCPDDLDCAPAYPSDGGSRKTLRAENLEPLPLRRSKRVPLNGERCAPGVTYMDECNTCICSNDGIKAHASCTFKICPK